MNKTPTPEMAALIARLETEDAGLPDPTTLPPQEGRALAERTNERWNEDLPQVAQVRDITLAGRPARRIVPHEDKGRGAVLYVHGGGFAFCSPTTHEGLVRRLAIACAAPVTSFSYRLAPEHPYPAAFQDTCSVWPEFAEMETGRALGIGGDSAGANLALCALLSGIAPQPALGLLFYGVFGADFESPSYVTFADGPGLTRAKMQRFFDWYAPAEARSDPLVSPLEADDAALRALPPLYLNAAGIDVLRSDAERLAARLEALGRTDQFDHFEGVIHGFMQMAVALPQAQRAIAAAGEAFQRTIDQQ